MTDLPRLELTEEPNKKNDYIIFRYSIKDKIKKNDTKKHFYKKYGKRNNKNNGKTKRSNTKRSKTKKGFFNLF
jgi:hypothetical protein